MIYLCTDNLNNFLKRICTSDLLIRFGIVLLIGIVHHFGLNAQDTQSPVVVVPAKDSSLLCISGQDLNMALTQWYNNAGGAMAQDDSGEVSFIASPDLEQAINTFNASNNTLCGNTRSVTVVFTAVDPSGNMSAPTEARFFTFDNESPVLIIPPNVTFNCVTGIRDTLIQWIRNKGGYQANDNCTESLTWTIFQYSITTGNTVIQSGGGSISSGPYPNIPDGVCNWRLNINFFVRDECNNQVITPGTTSFTVTDNQPPVLSLMPADMTVQCDSVPQIPVITATDACTMQVSVQFTESTTQNPDPTLCNHYNYIITRHWVATDNCGNSASHTQTIHVTDTTPPLIISQDEVMVSCIDIVSHPDSMYSFIALDLCSSVNTIFTDSIHSGDCDYLITRRHLSTDVCGNSSSFNQILRVKTNTGPLLVFPAGNRDFYCNDIIDFNAEFGIWVNNFGGSSAVQTCSPFKSFAAVPGSYNVTDTLSFPGTPPGQLEQQICPSSRPGYLRHESVDFVYYDLCGNVTVSNAVFGIRDTLKPLLTNCPEPILIATDPNDCMAVLTIRSPEATDDCLEVNSTVVRTITQPVISPNPGNNESVVDSLTLRLGPFNPNALNILNDGVVELEFRNLDIDDGPEFFRIKDEDGVIIGRSPNSTGQCANANMTLTIDKNKIQSWIQDGYIEFHFIPNVIQDNPVLSINDICNNSSIRASISFDIDITNALTQSLTINTLPPLPFVPGEPVQVTLPTGQHEMVFRFTDCAANTGECTVPVEVQDKTAPIINCPDNITIDLMKDSCMASVPVDINFLVSENCEGNRGYNRLIPATKESALITFIFNENTDNHLARSRQFIFPDVFPVRHLDHDVILEAEVFGDVGDDGESFEIFGSDGSWIGNTRLHTGSSECGLSRSTFSIPYSTFNSWISNGSVIFTAVPKSGPSINGGGINPCKPILPGQFTDGESYMQLRLKYTDAAFTIAVSGATVITPKSVPTDISQYLLKLEGGLNQITIGTIDKSGNTGSCNYTVLLRDNENPVARCKNFTVSVSPSGIDPYSIQFDDIDNGSSDNCDISSLIIEPQLINCSMRGDVQVKMILSDAAGNKDSCIAQVLVRSSEIRPTFSSGLCQNDTLKLFANPPPSSVNNVYSFRWQGPNGVEFFEENPFIPNVTSAFNGTYQVTVTGFNGCSAEGSVIVNIQPLTNPVISIESDTICEGDDVILTTTAFTGNVSYEWYEGVFPNGILLQITQSPNISVRPTAGVHFYYIIAQGEGCRSNASAFVRVTVLRVPQATVNNIFLTPCEGEEIRLGTSVTGSGFTYQWAGPAGYSETGQFPSVIQDVRFIHSGIYTLVIFNRQCSSDTAKTNVQVLERPAKPVLAGAEVFCQGSTFNLLATNSPGADSYDWYRDNVLFRTTLQNNLTVTNAQIILQGGWQVVAVRGNCRSEPSEIRNIGIINILEIGASNSGPACEGDSIRLQATFVPNANYKWSGPIPDIPSVQSPMIPAIPGEYSVTITTATLCENNASTTVQVINKPQITAISNSASACMDGNTPVMLSPSIFPPTGNYQFEWTFNNSLFSSERNPVISNAMLSDTGLYTLRVFNQNCPSDPVSTSVRFELSPPTPVIMASDFYCSGDTISIFAEISGTVSVYTWNTPLGTFETQTGILQIENVSATNSGAYSIIVSSGQCKSLASSPVAVTIRPKPIAPPVTAESPVCFGSDIILSTSAQTEVNYFWTGPGFESNERNPVIPQANVSNSGTYRLKTELNGCLSSNVSEINVQVLQKLTTPVIIPGNFSLCSDTDSKVEICIEPQSITLGATIQLIHAISGEVLNQGTEQCFFLSVSEMLSEGTNFFYAVAEKDACYSEKSANGIIRLSVAPNIEAGVTEENITICPGDFVTVISNHGPPEIELGWTSPDPELNILPNTERSVLLSGLKSGNNILLLNYSVPGCRNFSTDTVTVHMEFVPITENDQYEIIYNQNTNLNILGNDNVPSDIEIVIVTPPKYGKVIVQQSFVTYVPDPRFTEDVSFVYRVCGLFCENLCNEATVFLKIRDAVDCFGPNIITPNKDGYNDAFVIPCLSNGNFPQNQLYVFNQWGAQVFTASPYKNDWEGTHGGNPLPTGTYFYVLELGDGSNPLNGFLILQR
jgi:gliding motility-associated-like protein